MIFSGWLIWSHMTPFSCSSNHQKQVTVDIFSTARIADHLNDLEWASANCNLELNLENTHEVDLGVSWVSLLSVWALDLLKIVFAHQRAQSQSNYGFQAISALGAIAIFCCRAEYTSRAMAYSAHALNTKICSATIKLSNDNIGKTLTSSSGSLRMKATHIRCNIKGCNIYTMIKPTQVRIYQWWVAVHIRHIWP